MRPAHGGTGRHLGVTMFAALVILQAPLVTPSTTVGDPLVGASPAPVVTVEPPVGTPQPPAENESPPSAPLTPLPTELAPAAEGVPADADIGEPADRGERSGWRSYATMDLVILVLAALSTGLALVGLRERVRVPGPSLLGREPAERPFPPPARALLVAADTDSMPELFEMAAQRRFALRVDVLLLPVLARPDGHGAAWIECHDATDTWLWHESWLRSAATQPTAVEADGLLLGEENADAADDAGAAGRLLVIPGGTTVAVLPVAEGLILSRPAAGTVGELFQRWVRRVGIWRAEVRTRPAASVLLLHGLISFPLAFILPVVALLGDVPVEVTATAAGPLAVGFLAAALRWAALDDLDRSTSLRFPAGRGALLLLTAPLHAAIVWLATARGMVSSRPSRLVQRRLVDEEAA